MAWWFPLKGPEYDEIEQNIANYMRKPTDKSFFKATHYFAAHGKDHRNDQKGPVFHKVLPHHEFPFRISIFQFQFFSLVNFLKNCVSQQQTRFRQGHLISYVHVQKEAGADDDSVHEGSQSPYRQPSIVSN